MVTYSTKQKKILFISHSAGRTGAPIVLLHFLKWLKLNSSLKFEILLKDDGILKSDFGKLAPTKVFKPNMPLLSSSNIPSLWATPIRFISNVLIKQYIQKYKISQIGMIYCNTITNGDVLSCLAKLNCPVICHVHELEYWIHKSGLKNFEQIKQYTTRYIAVSDIVKQNLVLNHDIPADKVDVVHAFISFPDRTSNLKNVRDSLKIPKNSIIIGGSGAEIWRKGKDLFIQLAINVFNKCNDLPIYFVWIGGSKEGSEIYQLQHDISQAKRTDRIFLVPEVSNPMDYFAAFDIFAMVSREDPFPLVNLEAASLGKPIICFENAGGSPEFVENDAGFVVPYLDLDAMADKVITLAKDEALRHMLGNRAAQKVQERHDISVAAPQILKIIENLLESSC